jgi:hypothetical protein
MIPRFRLLFILLIIPALLLSACSGLVRRQSQAGQPPVPTEAPAADWTVPHAEAQSPAYPAVEVLVQTQVVEMPAEVLKVVTAPASLYYDRSGAQAQATPLPYPAPGMGGGSGGVFPSYSGGAAAAEAGPNRLIVKDAVLSLLVQDTNVALQRATQITADEGGYIISSRLWNQPFDAQADINLLYATLTLAVPVDRFEQTLTRLRELAIHILDESASGQDVTDEYVDLQSRLKNLEATRDRIRAFLDEAKTVEEAIMINEQLSLVEGQIEQVMGRMNYLFDRAAYSTITLTLNPDPPKITPTSTPTPTVTPSVTPTPTATPTATPTPWVPGATARVAADTLGTLLRGLVDFLIWFGIVVLPFALPLGLILWGGYRLNKRRLDKLRLDKRRLDKRRDATEKQSPLENDDEQS